MEGIGAIEQPGIYSVTYGVYACSDIYTVEVRDNVEIACVTVDLKTSNNKVIWQTTPEQAEYITSVKVCTEDGSTYSAPYQPGYFLFFGQENEPQNYHIIAVQKDGQECPVASYTKGTIHATYEQDADGLLNIQWNLPYLEPGSNDELTGFQICQYDAATETVTVVDEVAATTTDYTGDASLFVGAKVVVAAVFNNSIDNRSFSNLYTMLAVDENTEGGFNIYPNPAEGQFTIEGVGIMHIGNVLGQEIIVREINGRETIQLSQGMYFVSLNGKTQKIVVE